MPCKPLNFSAYMAGILYRFNRRPASGKIFWAGTKGYNAHTPRPSCAIWYNCEESHLRLFSLLVRLIFFSPKSDTSLKNFTSKTAVTFIKPGHAARPKRILRAEGGQHVRGAFASLSCKQRRGHAESRIHRPLETVKPDPPPAHKR